MEFCEFWTSSSEEFYLLPKIMLMINGICFSDSIFFGREGGEDRETTYKILRTTEPIALIFLPKGTIRNENYRSESEKTRFLEIQRLKCCSIINIWHRIPILKISRSTSQKIGNFPGRSAKYKCSVRCKLGSRTSRHLYVDTNQVLNLYNE